MLNVHFLFYDFEFDFIHTACIPYSYYMCQTALGFPSVSIHINNCQMSFISSKSSSAFPMIQIALPASTGISCNREKPPNHLYRKQGDGPISLKHGTWS